MGKVLYCRCMRGEDQVTPSQWSITSGAQYASINSNGRIDINEGVVQQTLTIQCTYNGVVA